MGEFVLTCQSQPSPGEPCPEGQDEWTTQASMVYGQARHVLLDAPPMGDVAVVMTVSTLLAILMRIPVLTGKIAEGVKKGSF